jgi:uncharacterized protein YndB with AHSA1/START domain
MNSTPPPVTIRVTRHFDAAPEHVFDAWLDAERAGRWFFSTPGGHMVRAEVDARVGGGFLFVDRRNGVDVEHMGEYLAIERPRRLAFTFAVPQFSPEHTRVTVDVAPAGDGSELTLTHEGVLAGYEERTEQGWHGILGGLAATLGEGGLTAASRPT